MTATYLGSGDPARRRTDYFPVWLNDLDDVTLEASAINGAAQGPEAVRFDHPGGQVALRVSGHQLHRRLRRQVLHRGLHDADPGQALRRDGRDHPQRQRGDPAHRRQPTAT